MNAPIDAPKPDFTALVSSYNGQKLIAQMDGTFDEKATSILPTLMGCQKQWGDPKEFNFQGIYCLMTSGELMLLDSLPALTEWKYRLM